MANSKTLNPALKGDGPEAQAVKVDEEQLIGPGRDAYRSTLRKELAAARYRDWLAEKRTLRSAIEGAPQREARGADKMLTSDKMKTRVKYR